jgi:DNA-binding beta-propeller fold protein YncE
LRLTLKFILAALALVIALGCQGIGFERSRSETPATMIGSEPLVWPSPPARARIRYAGSFATAEDLGIRKSFLGRLADFVLGREAGHLVRPTSVAEHGGIIYVADPGAAALWIFDRQGKRSIEVRQAGDDALITPVAVAPGPDGGVFLADSSLAKVFLFDRDGKLVRTIAGGLKRPAALAYDNFDGRLYVADSAGQRIVVFSRGGAKLLSWGQRGTGPGEFNYPIGIAVRGPGPVLVTDGLNYRVQAFDREGRFLWKFGHHGDGSGDFASPKGIALDSEGHIYVVDALFDAVQIFNRDGGLLLGFGEHGAAAGEFWLASGAFIDGHDRIYVADSYNQRVDLFQFLGGSERTGPAIVSAK